MNLKTRILWGFIVSLLCCCWGCEDKAADDTIDLSATTLFFESKAEAQSVNVASSATCYFSEVDKNQNWCIPTYDGSGVVSIMVTENLDYSARNTVIRVEAGNCIKEIDVIQQGKVGKLALTNTVLDVFDKNQTAVVGLETADAWNVSVSGNWLTAVPESGTGNQIVRFNFSENTMDVPRTAIITFSIPNETKTFVLTQGAKLPDDRMHDSLALVALYNSAEGESWPMKRNWLSGEPIDKWDGISVNEEGRVKSLFVVGGEEPFMSANSYIPEEIKYLTKLEAFMLTHSGIGGKLPAGLFRCSALKSIICAGKVGKVAGHLTGEIPLLIGSLSKLADLDLSRNQLEGGIPTEISGCPLNLALYLSNNKLTKLPTLLQATVAQADFSYNLFTGVVPQEWGGWFNPGRFTLMGNKDLGGELPAIWCEQGREVVILETSIIPCNK